MSVILRFYQYIFRYRLNFVIFLVLFAIGTLLQNIQPFLLREITTSVQDNGFIEALRLAVWLGAALIASTLIKSVAYFVSDKGMTRTSTDIQMEVMKHIHNLDFAFHTNKSSGKLISLMKRGDDAFYNFYDVLNREIFDLVLSFSLMVFAFSQLSLKYLIWSLAVVVISLLVSFPLLKKNLQKRKIFLKADDKVASRRTDNLLNFDTVKYFAKETFEQKKFAELLESCYHKTQDFFLTFRYFDLIIGNLSNIALAGTIVLAVMDLQSGAITFGDFVLISSFSATFFPQLMGLLFSLRVLIKNFSDLTEYFAILDEVPQVKDPAEPFPLSQSTGKISFKHVSFTYPAGSKVLEDFSLDIAPGESVAFVGYSGAGKTTIAKLLMRMYDPTQGFISVDDIPITNLKKETLRSFIGIVPQDPIMFNNTILYNLVYANPQADRSLIDKVTKQAKLNDFIDRLPSGLETMVGERGIKLSGGQRQRLAIARVLLAQPQIILFDEATSALDSESEKEIQAAFWNLAREGKQKRTSIIIAHRLSTIMRADRIIVLDKGTIAEQGTHRQLLNKGGIYQRLWKLQQDGFIGDGEYKTDDTIPANDEA